ncbi:rhodanese-like domain-containing protein [Roseivirga pacifica]|uniref:rhodanese-like domain-containing protein n=1 Tax=Roseivirga pacifica TaxID=1267423 RepID=UPI003BB14358
MKEITVEQLLERINSGEKINLFDVREYWEYDEDNIGAKCIPLGDLPKHLEELAPLKNEEIIIHCKSGARGGQAQKYLTAQGFENVVNVCGGILAYRELETA